MIASIDTQAALKHFTATDPIMARLLRQGLKGESTIEIPTAKHPDEYFGSIVRSIVSQQISVKAADAVFGRVITRVSGQAVRRETRRETPGITPESIMAVPEDELRACGLSGPKTRYIRHNAVIWKDIDTAHFSTADNEQVIHELTKLYGVGRWTAEMFLMFTLARPDVFSYGDLALMQGVYRNYPIRAHHVRKIDTLVASWAPHRTLASLALWWSKDNS